MLKTNDYTRLYIENSSVAEAIAMLQAWETENPEATQDWISIEYDGDDCIFVVFFRRPMTEEEIDLYSKQLAESAAWQERIERETYERLKAKYG